MSHRNHCTLNVMHQSRELAVCCYSQIDNIPSMLKDGIATNLRPVAYASKSLSEVEQNYANIEHELLGNVFAIETFKHFTYGRLTNIITDHKHHCLLSALLTHPQGYLTCCYEYVITILMCFSKGF